VQLREPRLWLVHDPEDAPASTRALHALADLGRGVAVVRVTPGLQTLQPIAADLLKALGKDHSLPGNIRSGEENWRRASVWMSGERVCQLIVDRAEALQPKRWQDFIGLAAHCGLDLWLVVHGGSLTRGQREMLDDWPLTEVTIEQFLAEHPDPGTDTDTEAPVKPDGPVEPFATVPRSDFTTFRADCHLLLAPEAFKRVEREMRYAADLTRRWLSETATPDSAGMKEHLRELIEDCRFTDLALARLRAAQAVCLLAGLLVTVDFERLAASMRTPRPLIDEQFVGELRRYACTRRAAASLISCLTAASPEAISRLNVSDVSDHEVRIAGKKFGVPAVARGVLAAHIHARLQAGARPDDALLSNAHCGSLGERCTPRTARRSIDDVARASGLMLWDERNTKDDHGDQQWLRRRGVSVSVVR
jgi:hypothetical protein